MTARKRVTKRKTTNAAKSRKTSTTKNVYAGKFLSFLFPLVLIVGIVFCLGFLVLMGFRTATASSFFDAKTIDIQGINRASKTEIESLVNREVSKTGVFNADLAQIKSDIEELTSVKTAAVSRVLPDGIRVNLVERIPLAVVSLDSGDFWADEEGVLLGKVEKTDERPPFALKGWDGSKTLKAFDENKERVKTYTQMLREWHDFEIAKRVSEVNLKDLQDVQAVIQDSGEPVRITLGNEDFGKRLREALKAVANKGKEIESVSFNGQSFVAQPRES